MQVAILMIHVVIAVALVVLILLQQGKGAEAGAAFGVVLHRRCSVRGAVVIFCRARQLSWRRVSSSPQWRWLTSRLKPDRRRKPASQTRV